MEFTRRKLPKEAATNLLSCPIHTVKPFALMLAPVYVFLRQNEKFVSVKAPLDFFAPEELQRFSVYENFYLPEFVETAIPFRTAARMARDILSCRPEDPRVPAPAPYEISDAVLKVVGPLWSGPNREKLQVEPFFAAVFANELCDSIGEEILLRAREQNVGRFEKAICYSSWTVFLATLAGYCSLPMLNSLRIRVFEEVLAGNPEESLKSLNTVIEHDEIVRLAFQSLHADCFRPVYTAFFQGRTERISQKLMSRLGRVSAHFGSLITPPSIFGEKGFADG